MKALFQPFFKSFSLKNRHTWSENRFAWFYATIILIAVAVFAYILKVVGIYESMAWRVFNIFFIIGGQALMVIDYKKRKDFKLDFTKAAFLCIRSGFYFALLYLPLLAFVLIGFSSYQDVINEEELFRPNEFTVQSIVFINWIEIIAAISVISFVVPHIIGFVKSPKKES